MTDAPALPTVWRALRPDGAPIANPFPDKKRALRAIAFNHQGWTGHPDDALAAGYRVVECRLVPVEARDG